MERYIKRLSRFEALIIDDLGYVQQSREEMEVLFTLLAERYERGSVLPKQQPTVLKMGADLQRSDDHSGSDRPVDTPQCDHRTEHRELSTRRSEEQAGRQAQGFLGWLQDCGASVLGSLTEGIF